MNFMSTNGIKPCVAGDRLTLTAVCGDAVMTRDFFKAQVGYYNSVDFDRSKQSIAILAGMVEVIVPGHDNYFFTKFYR